MRTFLPLGHRRGQTPSETSAEKPRQKPREALRRKPRSKREKSRGQSLVEFALVLPVFLVFLAAALDLGRVFFANITLNNAAREGAFEAAKHPVAFTNGSPCDWGDNAARVVCRVQFESSKSAITIDPTDIKESCSSTCTAAYGSTVTVRVRGTFQLVTPILSAIFGGQTIPLRSSATAQIEYYPSTTPATPPPAPVADFVGGPLRACPCSSLTVNFTDLTTGDPSAWQWDFGDGTGSTEQNPTHTFSSGNWTVSLTAINITNSSTKTKTNYIQVNVAATPTPTPTPAPTGAPTPTPTPTPAPTCSHPPNVIGQAPGTAVGNLNNAGFSPVSYGDLTTGTKNKVQAQNPDATQCLMPGTTIIIHWRPS
jgi:PKD repeat protein